jgi:hypothetical protein
MLSSVTIAVRIHTLRARARETIPPWSDRAGCCAGLPVRRCASTRSSPKPAGAGRGCHTPEDFSLDRGALWTSIGRHNSSLDCSPRIRGKQAFRGFWCWRLSISTRGHRRGLIGSSFIQNSSRKNGAIVPLGAPDSLSRLRRRSHRSGISCRVQAYQWVDPLSGKHGKRPAMQNFGGLSPDGYRSSAAG